MAALWAPRRLFRDMGWYGLIGGLQLVVDWLVFLVLTSLGTTAVVANLAGRVAGASMGFIANGRITFVSVDAPALTGRPLRRFIAMWLALTMMGTIAVATVAEHSGLALALAVKPAVDIGIAALQFFLSRVWVYR